MLSKFDGGLSWIRFTVEPDKLDIFDELGVVYLAIIKGK